MEVIDLSLKGVKLVKPSIFQDHRGYFTETYRENKYLEKNIGIKFVQDNHSLSFKNVIRGMHFQSYPGQDKLIFVISGKIFDVAVDIRLDSSTFGKWEGVELDSDKCFQLFIPKGFAHGFCVLSDQAHVVYKISSYFDPNKDFTFLYNDPSVNITWPVADPILSEKDRHAPLLKELHL
jgi:dTDP-4-dehydrorhamnose 3,5-epimerase